MEHPMMEQTVEALVKCFSNGGKLLICGNGGSSADSAHITGEFAKGFMKKRPLPKELADEIGCDRLQMGLPAIDLTAQSALISAVANDLGADLCYAQQVMAYGRPGDVIIGISTSGNAANVAMALKAGGALGLTRIAMTGAKGGLIKDMCDIWVGVPYDETYLVQEAHLNFYHRLCAAVEERFFPI